MEKADVAFLEPRTAFVGAWWCMYHLWTLQVKMKGLTLSIVITQSFMAPKRLHSKALSNETWTWRPSKWALRRPTSDKADRWPTEESRIQTAAAQLGAAARQLVPSSALYGPRKLGCCESRWQHHGGARCMPRRSEEETKERSILGAHGCGNPKYPKTSPEGSGWSEREWGKWGRTLRCISHSVSFLRKLEASFEHRVRLSYVLFFKKLWCRFKRHLKSPLLDE